MANGGQARRRPATRLDGTAGAAWCLWLAACTLLTRPMHSAETPRPAGDRRDIRTGLEIPSENYADQPYVAVNRDGGGAGLAVTTTQSKTLRPDLSDGKHTAGWDCDAGLLTAGRRHHVVFILDAGPRIISVVLDGQLCDGGAKRQRGWGRFGTLGDVTGAGKLRIAPSLKGTLHAVRIYDRFLRTGEAVGNYRAGLQSSGRGRAR